MTTSDCVRATDLKISDILTVFLPPARSLPMTDPYLILAGQNRQTHCGLLSLTVCSALVTLAVLATGCSDGAIILRGPAPSLTEDPVSPGSMEDSNDPGGTPDPGVPGSATAPGSVGSVGSTGGAAAPEVPGSATGGTGGTAIDGEGLTKWSPPALRNGVALADDDLARQALTLMGSAVVGAAGSCSACHSLGRPTLTRWQVLTDEFSAACLSQPSLADVAAVDAMVACFQRHAQPEPWSPPTFGIYSAAVHLPWFSFLFEHATEYGDDWRTHRDDFVTHVGMPRAGARLTQEQFSVVAEWFARGLPRLFELVPEDNGEDCTPGLDPRLGAHVADMAVSGWKVRNEQIPLLMFGCQNGQAGAQCLGQVPLAQATPFGAAWDVPGATIRVLYDNTGASSNYWSRSSADGRYIASGLRQAGSTGFSGQFVDLQQGRVIDGDFGYDPTFFPDNSGFMVQQAPYAASTGPTDGSANAEDTAIVCNQSVLAGDPDLITGTEPGCTPLSGQIGLYQQLAKSIDGEDYWVVYGSFDEDNGGFSIVLDNPSAAFESQSTTTLVPMVNQGTTFEVGQPSRLRTPLQGDPMLSPSGRLLVTRLKGREYTTVVAGKRVVTAEQSGYALHLVGTTKVGGALSASLADVGRVCVQGGKAVVSYDERWLVLHHYVTAADAVALGFSGQDDPDFAAYLELGASNLILVDLLDGSSRFITQMGAGQYALFPHFRSDGWLYFVVRTLAGEEYFAATDAALLAATSN
jgi:hypothetical protein